jgi:AraC-like DNA-binding protein
MMRCWTYEGIEFLHARYVGEAFVPHMHDEYSASVIVRGAMGFDLARESHIAGAAAIAVINPGEVHTGRPAVDDGWETRNILVPIAVLSSFAPQFDVRPSHLAGPVIWDWPAARAFVAAHAATARDPTPNLAKDVLLAQALSALFVGHSVERPTRTPARASTQRAQEYLREHFAERVRLSTLAALVGISRFHFIRTFARDTGLTPHAFQDQLRIAHGLRLLKQGLSATEAAAGAGYSDQSHFNRALKRSHGVTPGIVSTAR